MKIRLKDLNGFNALLIRKGFSKKRLAETVSMSAPMVVQISKGQRYPGPETAKKIVDALQVRWDEVFEIVPDQPAALMAE